MRIKARVARIPKGLSYLIVLILSVHAHLLFFLPHNSHALVTTSIAADNSLPTPTSVTQAGNVFNINGGTIKGANQFQSFDTFSVGAGDIASFNGPGGIANILSRVTGLDSGLAPSMIYGTIQSTIPGANLFFMNPAGIVFGPTASLNIAGTVSFTTANYIRLFDGVNSASFYANPANDAVTTPGQVSILSSAPLADFGFVPAAFGFLDANPASITVQGSTLSVPVGQSIALVGGDISVVSDPDTGTPAALMAPAGEILLASVASPGEILLPNLQTGPNINGQSFSTMGTATLSEGAFLDVSDNALEAGGAGGTIRIRGGQLVMDNAVLFSATQGDDVDGASTAVDINLTGDIALNNFSAIASQSSGQGSSGDITINAHNVDVAGQSTIASNTSGDGQAGDISIMASGSLSVHGTDGQGNFSNIESLTDGSTGDSGNISIIADTVALNEQGYIQTKTLTDGNAGNIEVQAANVALGSGGFIQTLGQGQGQGSTGSLMVAATDTVSLVGDLQFSQIQQTSLGNVQLGTGSGGGISVSAKNFQLTDGAQVINQSNTAGGPVIITTSDSILIGGGSEINSKTFFGSIGPIQLSAAKSITLSDHAVLRASTIGNGTGGTISLTAESISLSGQSFITSRTVSSGQGGQIQLTASDSVSLSGGAIITTSSLDSATGAAGSIAITAGKQVSLMDSGTKVLSEANGSGAGGNISIAAGQATTLNNGASISASSTGPGNAGNISINAGQQFEMHNSSVKTEAAQASGGNIDIQAVDRVRLVNSSISTSVLGGAGSGGNITIDPNVVVLQNSQIIAQAIQGTGGNIMITTPLFLADSTSLVSASSQFGLNGTVTIQSPTSNLSGSLGTLTSKPSQAQSLLTQRCAALANGQASSFVVAGREQLPADPGGWLSSPLAYAALGGTLDAGDAVASAPAIMAIAAHDTGTVSLRRLTPAGFLIANFADSEATGCHS